LHSPHIDPLICESTFNHSFVHLHSTTHLSAPSMLTASMLTLIPSVAPTLSLSLSLTHSSNPLARYLALLFTLSYSLLLTTLAHSACCSFTVPFALSRPLSCHLALSLPCFRSLRHTHSLPPSRARSFSTKSRPLSRARVCSTQEWRNCTPNATNFSFDGLSVLL